MTVYRNYHPNFRARRSKLLTEFDNRCMRCGVKNRTIAYNSNGEVYVIFLHTAHVFRNEKMEPDCYLIPLCPTCHWFFDHPRKHPPGSLDDWSFIGEVARHFLEKESREMEEQRAKERQSVCENAHEGQAL